MEIGLEHVRARARPAPHRGAWRRALLVPLAASLLIGSACGSSGGSTAAASRRYSAPTDFGNQQYGGQYTDRHASGDTAAGAEFARFVLEQDPQRQYITDAVVRGEQDLGIRVQPTVRKGELEQLMTALARGMARTFPGRPISVIAFYQSGDKLAEAEYDPRSDQVRFS